MIKSNRIVEVSLERNLQNKMGNISKTADEYERNDYVIKQFMIYGQSDLQNPRPPLDPLEPLDVWRRRPMPRRLFQTTIRSTIEIRESIDYIL